MRRIVVVLCCLAVFAAAGQARAESLGCGLPDVRPLWIEFADGTVDFRLEIFGRPGVIVGTSGAVRSAELRALGARTVYWHMSLKGLAGTPTVPNDAATLKARVAELVEKARAATGCQTPVIALNELWGVWRPTPWPPQIITYRQNVLAVMRQLRDAGLKPFLLVPGPPAGGKAPYVGDTAADWWREIAKAGWIVREMHFNAPYVYRLGVYAGSRARRVAMRTALEALTGLGIAGDRLGLMLGFQSGPGKGGREGLSPDHRWFEIVKRDALAARQVASEIGISTIWSWGWGTFNVAGADPDKPRAACVYLWTRDPSLCDGPAAAGPGFLLSTTAGQINLAPGVQCRTGAGVIRTNAMEALLPATADDRVAAMTALLNRRLVGKLGARVEKADVASALQQVLVQHFGGSLEAYQAAIEERGLGDDLVNTILADQLRRQAAEAALAVSSPGLGIWSWTHRRLGAALRRAVCRRDELPARKIFVWRDYHPLLEVPAASVTISAGSPVVRRGGSTTLSGAVVSARASETVSVYARRGSGSAFRRVTSVAVGSDGSWSAVVSPSGTTSYRAVSKSAASRTLSVRTRGR